MIANESQGQSLDRIWSKGMTNGQFSQAVYSAFTNDNKYLLTAGIDGSIKVWDAETGEYIYKLLNTKSPNSYILLSPDNKRFIYGGFSDQFNLYNYTSDSIELYSAKMESLIGFNPRNFKFTENNSLMVFSSSTEPSISKIEFKDSLKVDRKYLPFSIWGSVIFSNDGKYFAWYPKFNPDILELVIFSFQNFDTLAFFNEIDPQQYKIGFTSNFFYLHGFDSIRIYDLSDFHLKSTHYLPNLNSTISNDGKFAITIDTLNNLTLWDLNNFKQVYTIKILKPQSKNLVTVFSPENMYFFVSGTIDNSTDLNINSYFECYEKNSGNKLWNTKYDFNGSQRLSISPDNKYVLAAGGGGGLNLLRQENGELIKILNERIYFSGNSGCDFSNDSIHFAYTYHLSDLSPEGRVMIYNINDLEKIDTINVGNEGATCLKFSPDGKCIAIGLKKEDSFNTEKFYWIQMYDINTKKLLFQHKLTKMAISLAFSLNRNRLVVCTENSYLYIIDFENNSIVNSMRLEPKGKIINKVDLNNDGTIAVTANTDGTICIWNLYKNEVMRTINDQGINIRTVKISSDGKTLISCGSDSKIKFWDINSGDLKYTTTKKQTGLYFSGFSISNDEKFLVMGDLRDDGILMFSLDMSTGGIHDINYKLKRMFISPNPAFDFIEINQTNGASPVASEKVQIFDVLGVEVMSVGIGLDLSTQRINISHLPTGVYFIRIGGRVEKFVKI